MYLLYMWHICIFFWKESHSFHYLLKFVKKLQITLLLTLATRSHPHSQTDHTTHFPVTSSSASLAQNPLQTLISNCLLHICLWMLHKHLQLNEYKIRHVISAPSQLSVLLLYSLHQPLSLSSGKSELSWIPAFSLFPHPSFTKPLPRTILP